MACNTNDCSHATVRVSRVSTLHEARLEAARFARVQSIAARRPAERNRESGCRTGSRDDAGQRLALGHAAGASQRMELALPCRVVVQNHPSFRLSAPHLLEAAFLKTSFSQNHLLRSEEHTSEL